jgi:hypothetical protein
VNGFGETLRQIAAWTVLAAAAAGLVLVLQWKAPERSVQPVADKFTCREGIVAIGETDGPGSVRQVVCVDGRTSEDVTALTMLALGVPCLLVLVSLTVLMRHFLSPRERRRIGQAVQI